MNPSTHRDREQEIIDREASAWLIWIEEDGFGGEEELDFRRWLAGDPRRRETYDAMRETWADIAQVTNLADLAPMPKRVPADRHPLLHAGGSRRWTTVTAVAASIAAGIFLFFDRPATSDRHYQTDLAETRIITLPDGSSVTLGARSSVTIAYKPKERRVVLSSGEALFDVVHDARRPFVVEAGDSLVRDLSTKFDVNRSVGSVRVGVIEGRVRVSRADDAGASAVTVGGGEGVQLAQDPARSSVGNAAAPGSRIVVTSQQAPGAWREGRLVFDNVRLADLSADINRYYAPGVTLGSPSVGELRVTAAFKTSEIPAFMNALDTTLPVRIERMPGGGFRIADMPR